MFGVSARTIERDGALANAVDAIELACGEDIKAWLLARGGPLRRAGLLEFAGLEPPRMRRIIFRWRVEGKFPRDWRDEGHRKTITLPRYFQEFVDTLVRKTRPEEVDAIFGYFCEVMSE